MHELNLESMLNPRIDALTAVLVHIWLVLLFYPICADNIGKMDHFLYNSQKDELAVLHGSD